MASLVGSRALAAVCSVSFGLASSAAQCTVQWQAGQGVPGIAGDTWWGGSVTACTLWDPDGPGVMSERLVIGGVFPWVVDTAARNIASFDPVTGRWAPIGGGIGGGPFDVRTVAALPNGGLVVGFTNSATVTLWDGSTWSSLPSLPRQPAVLLGLTNNEVVASCPEYVQTPPVTGIYQDQIYRWNGTTWLPLGSRFSNGTIHSMAQLPNGDLVAAGDFTAVGSGLVNRIARWNGSSWQPLGAGIGDGRVGRLTVAPNGDVIAVGYFSLAGGQPANGVARWDGLLWSALGSGVTGVGAVTTSTNGDVWVGGSSNDQGFLTRWDGTTWSPAVPALASGRFLGAAGVSHVVALPSQDVFVAGSFQLAGGVPAIGIARWDGSSWLAFGSGLDTFVEAMVVLPNGQLVTGGGWLNTLMRWDGTAWTSIGRFPGHTASLAAMPNGDVVAAGAFEVPTRLLQGVLRWDGSAWTPLGSLNAVTTAIAALANGDIVAATSNSIVRWDGSQWRTFAGVVDGPVDVLYPLSSGRLVAGGRFTTIGGVTARSVAIWNGAAWSPLGAGFDGNVNAIAELPNGVLAVGGASSHHSELRLWDGSSWTGIRSSRGPVEALLLLPNGDLLAGGQFPGHLERWDGVVWTSPAGAMNGTVYALAMLPNGDVFAGGTFQTAGGVLAACAARLVPTCAATAVSNMTSCVGTVGPVVLRATSLPWVGSRYAATASGFAGNALAAVVTGFQSPGIPLTSIHPAGLPNCLLAARPDALELQLPVAGVAATAIALPNDPALAQVRLYQQFLQAEFGSAGLALSSSNALVLTTGVF